jgi:hypothetical protein
MPGVYLNTSAWPWTCKRRLHAGWGAFARNQNCFEFFSLGQGPRERQNRRGSVWEGPTETFQLRTVHCAIARSAMQPRGLPVSLDLKEGLLCRQPCMFCGLCPSVCMDPGKGLSLLFQSYEMKITESIILD